MGDERIAMYVYETSSITIDPGTQAIDFMSMNDDYTAKFQTTLTEPYTNDYSPGVYGFVYNGSHGVTVNNGDVTLRTDEYDLQRKKPWPQPPPPPPPPYSARTDWADHLDIFLSPLGSTFDLGADLSASRG